MAKEKILIVEDMSVLAADLKYKLEEFGYDIIGIASSGEHAISIAEMNPPDLVLMDVILAGELDGIETARMLKENCNAGIMFLTGHMNPNLIDKAKSVKPVGYLLKPYKIDQLRITIEMALSKVHADREIENHKNNLESLVTQRSEELQKAYKRVETHANLLTILHQIISISDEGNNLELIMKGVLDKVIELIGFDGGRIYIKEGQIAKTIAFNNIAPELVKTYDNLDIEKSPFKTVFVDGKTAVFESYADDFPLHRKKYNIKSGISVPIISNNDVIGSINIINTNSYEFDNTEVKTLEAVARELGQKIEKIKINQEYIEEKLKLEELFNSINDYIFVTSTNGTILKANSPVYKRLGYKIEELENKKFSSLLARKETSDFSSIEETTDESTVLLKLKKSDGTIIDIDVSVSSGHWEKQEVFFTICRPK